VRISSSDRRIANQRGNAVLAETDDKDLPGLADCVGDRIDLGRRIDQPRFLFCLRLAVPEALV